MDEWYSQQVVGIQASGMRNPDDWFVHALQLNESDTDITVNGTTVLTSGPVFQAVSILAGDVAQLPLQLYKRVNENQKERDRRHPAHRLLNVEPHPDILPNEFKETMQAWALLWGNACAYVERNRRGEPVSLTPLPPDEMESDIDEQGRQFFIRWPKDTGQPIPYPATDILHLSGLGNGTWGYSVIDLMRNSVGNNLALQRHGNKHFANGARPSGVLKLAGKMGPEERQVLRRDWEEMHRGSDNAGRVAILPLGIDFTPMSVSNEDAQFIESRKFSREEIAAWFNLPPHKLGAMEQSSVRANLEEQNRDYLNTTLMRHLVKWQEECARKLLTRKQRMDESRFFRFNTAALLRGDIKSRYEAYAIAKQWGWESTNTILDHEDRNGIGPEGDVYLQPLNMVPAGTEPETADTDEGVPVEDTTPTEDTPTTDTNARLALRLMVSDAAEKICRIEAERLKRATRQKDNFCDWVGEFYGTFGATLSKSLDVANQAATLCGAGAADLYGLTDDYCEGHKEQLLTIAGQVTTRDELHDEVSRCLGNWRANAQTITEGILT